MRNWDWKTTHLNFRFTISLNLILLRMWRIRVEFLYEFSQKDVPSCLNLWQERHVLSVIELKLIAVITIALDMLYVIKTLQILELKRELPILLVMYNKWAVDSPNNLSLVDKQATFTVCNIFYRYWRKLVWFEVNTFQVMRMMQVFVQIIIQGQRSM